MADRIVAQRYVACVAVWQAQVAAGERDRARAAQAEAEESVTFLTNLFENAAAEERLLEARAMHKQVEEPDSALMADLSLVLATLYTERDQTEKAQRWRERADSLSAALSP